MTHVKSINAKLLLLLFSVTCCKQRVMKIIGLLIPIMNLDPAKQVYESSWESLKKHGTPQWLRDGKFGIYTHWGIYCYTATQGNATWNVNAAYMCPGIRKRLRIFTRNLVNLRRNLAIRTLSRNSLHKSLMLMNGPICLQNPELNSLVRLPSITMALPCGIPNIRNGMLLEWGRKEMSSANWKKPLKEKEMKFVTAFHHAENWDWFPTMDKTKDCSNPEYSGLYGPVHEAGAIPSKEFLDEWYGKLMEVVDKYEPDFIWFDFALDQIQEDYVKNYVAYYYNNAAELGKDVIISYKDHDLPPGVGLHIMSLDWDPTHPFRMDH